MPGFISDSPLARGLIRIGDEAIAREDDAMLRDYSMRATPGSLPPSTTHSPGSTR